MRIDTQIENVDSRYNVQISTSKFTALEEEKMLEFGEPTIDIGGSFSGSLTRPGTTNTVVSFTGGGTGAVFTPTILAGVITGFVFVSGGSGYSSPTVVITGDGTGAAATAVVTSGAITAVNVVSGGTGYHVAPVAVAFSFPSALRRIRTDSPIKRVFDLGDSVDADIMAQVYATAIVSALATAKTNLIASVSDFTGESAVTV